MTMSLRPRASAAERAPSAESSLMPKMPLRLGFPWSMPSAALSAESRRPPPFKRSEEHTSELQSRQYLVCRLLLEKKNHYIFPMIHLKLASDAPVRLSLQPATSSLQPPHPTLQSLLLKPTSKI